VLAGQTVTFTVKPPAGVTGTLQYDWTQTSPYSTLSASDGTGNKITTSSLTVQLVTTPSDNAPITVTVIAYVVSGGTRVAAGTASTEVTVSNTLAENTMSIISTDSSLSQNNFTQVFPVSLNIGNGALPGTWVWSLSDLGDPGDYPFAVRITTPVLDELVPAPGSSISIPYTAANQSRAWVLTYGNGIYGSGSAMVLTRAASPSGGYTYNITFTATNNTQVVTGRASFNVTNFPPG
jgi:hypothetical protein